MADITSTAAADVKATVTKELTFFQTHPKAIAIGAAAATFALTLGVEFLLKII